MVRKVIAGQELLKASGTVTGRLVGAMRIAFVDNVDERRGCLGRVLQCKGGSQDPHRRLPMVRSRRVVLVSLGVWLLLVAAASAVTPLATYEAPTGISANRGSVVWSAYDPAAHQFQLTLSMRGRVRAAAVRPRGVPFDADVGRNAAGGTLIVYSRCARESYDPQTATSRARDCDLYALDPSGDRERAIHVSGARSASDSDPVVWGNRVVFTRSQGGRSRMYVAPVAGGRARAVSLRGVRDAAIWDKDLLGERLAVAITRDVSGADATEVRLQQLDGSRRDSSCAKRSEKPSANSSGSASTAAGSASRWCATRPVEAASHGTAYRYFAGKLESASVPASLEDFALTRGRALWVDMPDEEDFHWIVEDAGSLPFGAS